LLEFIRDTEFEKIGVFNYSIEDNTPSYILGDMVSEEIKEERKYLLMELQREISLKKNQMHIGKRLKVLIDDIEGDYFVGRTENDAPEVDGEVLIKAADKLLKVGNFYDIEIYDCNDYDLFGKL
jgi:ribosomal protein S12 methylthiotransferase